MPCTRSQALQGMFPPRQNHGKIGFFIGRKFKVKPALAESCIKIGRAEAVYKINGRKIQRPP